MISRPAKRFYVFGVFRIDVTERVLINENTAVSLTPKAFDTLLVLVQNSGHVLSTEELMTQVWPDSFVEENNLAQNISTLRKVLSTGGDRFIETVPKRGYRFSAEVKESSEDAGEILVRERTRARVVVEEDDEAPVTLVREPVLTLPPAVVNPQRSSELELPLERPPDTMYARSGDVNIAYQVIGEGPLDLVFVMGWVSHLEYFWREPSFARFLMRLLFFFRFILVGQRRAGLTDPVPINRLPTLEERMDDVRAVMNAVGSKR